MRLMKSPKELYPRLLEDTHRTIADDQARQQMQYRWIIKIIVLFVTITALIELISGELRLAGALLLVAAIFFGNYWLVYWFKDRGVLFTSIAMMIETLAFYTFVLIRGDADGFAAVWILLLPSIAMILMGKRLATFICTVFVLEIIFFFFTPFGNSLLYYPYSEGFRIRLLIVFVILLLVNLFSEILRSITVDELRASHRNMEATYQQQYSNMKIRIDDARKARHDLRHHFMMIDRLLSDGKIEELHDYIHHYHDALPYEESLIYCDHYATNALLTYCAQRAKAFDIPKEIHVDYPESLPFAIGDLTVAFGNLLENALEATQRSLLADKTFVPSIQVTGSFDGNMLLFSVQNTSAQEAVTDATGRYKSSKRTGVGIGISSVKGIADKYHGDLVIKQENGTFTADLYLKSE